MRSSRAFDKPTKSTLKRTRARKAKDAKLHMLWICIHCNKTFVLHGVSSMLTVKCPHCATLMSINELFFGGRALLYAGLQMMDRCTEMIAAADEYGGGFRPNVEGCVVATEIDMLKRLIQNMLKELPNTITVAEIDEDARDWIAKNREQDAYFEDTPNSTLKSGTIVNL